MDKKILRSFSIVVVMLMVSSSFVFADVVHLKGGGKLEGKIVKQDASSLTLKMSYGEITIKKNEIASITYGEVESPASKPPIVKPQVVEPPKLSKEEEEKEIKDYFVRVCEIEYRMCAACGKFHSGREHFKSQGGFGTQWHLDRIEEVKGGYERLKEITPPPKLKRCHYHLLREWDWRIKGMVSLGEGGDGREIEDSIYEGIKQYEELRKINLHELKHDISEEIRSKRIEEERKKQRKK